MCNLYNTKASREEIAGLFRARDLGRELVSKDYAAPGKPGFVVREAQGERLLDEMVWGFPFQGKPVTNVRNYESRFWRSALEHPAQRCLVPVTSFQEWTARPDPQTGKKRPCWFSLPSRPVFAFAGIWRKAEPEPVYAFLTCGYDGDPDAHVVGRVHPKAIPVILHEDDHECWLHADVDDALKLATPFPSQLMAMA